MFPLPPIKNAFHEAQLCVDPLIEPDAQIFFEGLNLAVDRGRGQGNAARRFGQATGLDCHQAADSSKFHAQIVQDGLRKRESRIIAL